MSSDSSKVIPGLFTPLGEKRALVRTWPGIDAKRVDQAFRMAEQTGVIARYEEEKRGNPFLDLVITIHLRSLSETLCYAHTRMKTTHHRKYIEWREAFDRYIDDDRVRLINGACPFVPNQIVIEIVDFAANWDRGERLVPSVVQERDASRLAGFAVLYNASQSPRWVKNMDGYRVPYALVSTLLINVPEVDPWAYSPSVQFSENDAELGGGYLDRPSALHAMPMLK